jgi:hypothetical protein
MIRGELDDAGERTPDELRATYAGWLQAAVSEVGVDAVVAETDLDRETVEAIAAGDDPELTLEDAAAVLALDPDRPDADAIVAEARDILMMGMTTAVLDVEAVQSGIDDRLEAKEIQMKIEGRFPVTLAEYALLQQFIESRK